MVVVVVWGPRRPEDTVCDGLQANPPELDQAEDLASLVSVNESSVLNTLLHRYQAQLPHTHAGPDLIFLQPQGLMAPSAGKVRGPQGRGGARPGSFCISGPEPPEPLQACLSGILQTWLLGCQSIGEPWGPHGPPSLEGTRRDTNRAGARETVTVGENVSDVSGLSGSALGSSACRLSQSSGPREDWEAGPTPDSGSGLEELG